MPFFTKYDKKNEESDRSWKLSKWVEERGIWCQLDLKNKYYNFSKRNCSTHPSLKGRYYTTFSWEFTSLFIKLFPLSQKIEMEKSRCKDTPLDYYYRSFLCKHNLTTALKLLDLTVCMYVYQHWQTNKGSGWWDS